MKHNIWLALFGFSASFWGGLFPASVAAQSYSITDLGTLHYHQPGYAREPFASKANAVNDLGQVVGESNGHAFLWSRGKMTFLGTLGGANSEAMAINATGQIVGNSDTGRYYESGDPTNPQIEYHHAFLWSAGKMMDFGNVGDYHGLSSIQIEATSINAKGQVVIYVKASVGQPSSFLYSEGRVKDFGKYNGTGSSGFNFVATAINNRGQMAGAGGAFSLDSGRYDRHALKYSNGNVQDIWIMTGVSANRANAINNLGDVAGDCYIVANPGSRSHPFLYSHGRLRDLGFLPGSENGVAASINDKDQVVGTMEAPGEMETGRIDNRAFLYKNGRLIDLTTLLPRGSKWSRLFEATGINNRSQVVGSGMIRTSTGTESHAFLLTPK